MYRIECVLEFRLFIPFIHSFWSFTTLFSGSFFLDHRKCERLLLHVIIHFFLRLLLYEMMTTIMTISYYTTSPRTNTFKTTKFNILEIHIQITIHTYIRIFLLFPLHPESLTPSISTLIYILFSTSQPFIGYAQRYDGNVLLL